MRVATWTEGCLARLARTVCRYLPVDGGGGARLLAQLPTLSPYVRRVSSPRHAEILLVCEPISRLLVPAIVALYRAMPRPCGVLVVGDPGPEHYPGTDLVRLEDVLPGVVRVAATLRSLTELAQRMRTLPLQADAVPLGLHDDAQTVSLLEKQERDIATELVVLSLGPLQPLTAGPLRLLLLCHGEQVTSAQIEAGYAVRNLTRAMLRASWAARAALASALDPLAPVAGRLAYVPALEQLQGWEPDPSVQHQRDAALALERAQNALAWLARFVALLDAARLVATAQQLHERLTEISEGFWEQAPDAWIAPQGSAPLMQWNGQGASLARLATALEALRGRLARDRPLALRMTGLGVLTVERLRAAGADGPTYRARERGHDDVLDRLLTRLDEAAADLHHAAARVVPYRPATERPALWSAPRGTPDVAIAGPRGHIGLSITSDGETLCQVVWRRPSAVLLGLLPELRAGHKLADAEVIIASLDLAMAEADGSPLSSNRTDMRCSTYLLHCYSQAWMSPWPVLLAVLAALTMTVGNLCALRQTGVKRLLAYSSIGQAGYLLVGVAAADRDALAVPGLLLYLEVYLCMNLGAFLVVDTIERQIHTDDLTHFAGLGRPLPLSAAVLTLCLLSLAGFPSLGGFVGKTMLFGPALGAEWTWLAVVMGANVALSLFYYVRVCFVVILCQLRRNSLAPCPRDPGEFPCSTKECSFTLRRNTLPKVQIATYALPKNLSHILCTKQSGICLFPPFSWSLLYGEVARLCGDQSSRGVSRNFLPLHSQAIGGLKRIKTRPPALDRHHHPAFGKVMWRSGTDIRQSTAGPRTIVCAHGRESPSHAGAPSAPAGALGPQPGDTGQRRAAATMGRHRASRCRVMGTWRQLTEGKAG